MRTKKFYIPIGALILAICAIAFFALRSDIPKEPIVIIKTVQPIKPIKRSSTPETTPTADARTFSASMSKEETAVVDKNAEMPTLSEASEYAEFSRAELLERFPQYDFHSPASRENLHAILRNEKIIAEKEAQLAFYKAQYSLADYVERAVFRLETEYADVTAFDKKYPDPQEADFIREYPDETERYAFFERVLEAAEIRREMAARYFAVPGLVERLSPRHQEMLRDTANALSRDEISTALEILRSQGGLE